ncbi:MAG: glycosyltransferase family 4 protein [Alistipes sp.]|nr:glycosyltransferase family 4 protein [Alistipes sp.]
MKPIFQIFASAAWGGGEQFVADLSRRLVADGRQVVLIARRPGRVVRERTADLPVPFFRLPLKGAVDLISAAGLAWLMLRHRPAVVHVHHFRDAFTALYARALVRLFGVRPRIVLTRHLVRKAKSDRLHRWMYRRLDGLAFVSERARSEFFAAAPGIGRERTSVILNSSTEDRLRGEAPDLRRLYGVAPEVPLLLFCGRLVEEKGCDVLLRACARVGRGRRFALFFAGTPADSAYAAKLRALAADLPSGVRAEFLGFVPNAGALLAQADISVQPSVVAEAGGGLSVIESMQAGRAVVASDNGSQPEYAVAGVTGLLVPPGNDEALAAALVRLIDDKVLRDGMGAAGRRHFEENLAYEHFYRKYLAFYDGQTA